MVRGTVQEDGKVHFSYSKCDGMCQHYVAVDKDWFDANNTEDMTEEELESLAYKNKEKSNAYARVNWWGLG